MYTVLNIYYIKQGDPNSIKNHISNMAMEN